MDIKFITDSDIGKIAKYDAENPVILFDSSRKTPLLLLELSGIGAKMGFYISASALASLHEEIGNYLRGAALHPELVNSPDKLQ